MMYNFVIVNYNNSEVSLNCVRSINKIIQPHNVLIVDNNSDEKHKRRLECSGVSVLFLKSNVGYAKAINAGIDFYYKKFKSNQIVIAGNNDLYYDENFCKAIEFSKYSSDTMILCPDIIKYCSGVHQNPFVIHQYKKVELLKYDIMYTNFYLTKFLLAVHKKIFGLKSEKNRNGFDRSQYIYSGHGACIILLPLFLEKCRRLDCPTFLFGEELFIGLQIHANKGCIYYDKNIKVIHKEHTTTGSELSKFKFSCMKDSYTKFRRSLSISER